MAPQPTDNALAARRILRRDALPAIEKRLKTRPRFIDQIADVAADNTLAVVRPAETGSGGWALVRCGIGIVSNVASIVPPPEQGGPKRSFTGGVLLGAMVAAVAGDQMLAAPAPDAPAPDAPAPDAPAPDAPAPDTPAPEGARPDAPDPRDEAARLAEELLDPVASPQSRETFASDLIAQLDQDIPGIDHALAGVTLQTLGVWLAGAAAEVAAPIANSGVLRRKINQAPAGCGFAGALIAQIGLALS